MSVTKDDDFDALGGKYWDSPADQAEGNLSSPATPSPSRVRSPFARPTTLLSPTRPRDVLLSPPKPPPDVDSTESTLDHPYRLFLELDEADLPPPLSPPMPSRSSCSPDAESQKMASKQITTPERLHSTHQKSFSAASPRTKRLVSTNTPDLNYHARSQSHNSPSNAAAAVKPSWLSKEPSPERVWSAALKLGRTKPLVKGNSETIDADVHMSKIDGETAGTVLSDTDKTPSSSPSVSAGVIPGSSEDFRESNEPELDAGAGVCDMSALGIINSQSLEDERLKRATSNRVPVNLPVPQVQPVARPGHERRPSRKQVPNSNIDEEARKQKAGRQREARSSSPQLVRRAIPPSAAPTPTLLYGPRDDPPPMVPRHHVLPERSATVPQLSAPSRKGISSPLSPPPGASSSLPHSGISHSAPATPAHTQESHFPANSLWSGFGAYAACFAAGCVFTLLLTKGPGAAGVASLLAVGLYVAQGPIFEAIGAAGAAAQSQRPLRRMQSRADPRLQQERKKSHFPSHAVPSAPPSMAFGTVFGAQPRKKSSSVDEVHAYRPYPKREIMSGDDLAMD